MVAISPQWVSSVATAAVAVIIAAVLTLFVIRGFQMMKLKIDLIKRYTQLVGMGATPALGFLKSILYYVPIIRVVLLIEDLTFINNVFGTIEKNKKVEQGDL
jgi:hypothetical protein